MAEHGFEQAVRVRQIMRRQLCEGLHEAKHRGEMQKQECVTQLKLPETPLIKSWFECLSMCAHQVGTVDFSGLWMLRLM